MTHTLTYIKSFVAFIIVWFTDAFVLRFSALTILGPDTKEIIAQCKDVISIIATITIIILTVVRIRNENKKDNDKK